VGRNVSAGAGAGKEIGVEPPRRKDAKFLWIYSLASLRLGGSNH
jgi:environmental stress-induced protein Ves